jgi:IclR family acetate operon transcriptional repressor
LNNGTGLSTSTTVERALDLLEVLRVADAPLGVRDIARRLGTSPATAHRLIGALRRHGFVEQDSSRAYHLGWRLLDYASVLLRRNDLASIADPVARRLRERTGETITVQVPVGTDRVCVYELEGIHEIRRRVGVGRRVPLHAGASGRAILAFIPADRMPPAAASRLDRLTSHTVTDARALRELLAETRRSGLAWSAGETVDGVASIATPVFGASGEVAGSIAVSGPSGRWTHEAMAACAPELLAAGLELSRGIGYRDTPRWTEAGDA